MPTTSRPAFPLSALLTAQFFGAFNDNAFKMIVVLLGLAAVEGQGEVAKQGVTTLAMVAPGIAEALIATAMGLFAAIPAVIAYNRFSNDVERLLNGYHNFMEEFAHLLHRQAYDREVRTRQAEVRGQ